MDRMSRPVGTSFELDGAPTKALVTPGPEGRFDVVLDAAESSHQVFLLRGGTRPLFLVDGKVLPLSVEDHRSERQVTLRADVHTVRTDRATASAGAVRRSGRVDAPMPGRVLAVLVRAGQRVERDAPLLVLEAMKMQNQVLSPVAGVVRQVSVRPGDAVERGALLVDLT